MFDQSNSKEADFLRRHFADYYASHFVDFVPSVELREFGFGVFKRKIANRNMSFASAAEMNSFLRTSAPMFFSYSNACYKFPSRTPTPQKQFIKADLIYEFDADELGLEVPEINGVQWFAKEHLDEAKRQVYRLLDLLKNDFNFPQEGISINFSGKAGYHVHLRQEALQHLNRRARIELVDYLTVTGIDFANLGFDFTALSCPAHRGLLAKRIILEAKNILQGEAKVISKIGGVHEKKIPVKTIAAILESREKLFASLDAGRLMPLGKKSGDFWEAIFDAAVEKCAVPIDRQTSVDLNKIIRVPETLHGDTGLLAKSIPLDSLEKFDPFVDAVVFGDDPVKIHITKAPKFSLKGELFGPFEEADTELPLFAAVFLLGKGAAHLVQ